MNKPTKILPILLMILIGMSLACNFSFSLSDPTPTPSPTQAPPTDTPIPPPPTLPPPPTIAPTAIGAPITQATEVQSPQGSVLNPDASSSGDIYYSETMENLDNWSHFLLKGDEADVNFEVFDNRWRSEINAQDTWLYYMFEGGNFSDIQIDLQVENRASNTNFVGIICRYSENGWYETNILNTGEYFVYYSTGENGGNQLSTMHKGASRSILTGKKVNNYTVICQSDQLSIFINGTEAVSIPLRTGEYRYLPEGQVGLSVSTTSVIPVVVDFLQYILSVP